MLISSYHHVLKSKWLQGKQNRRADHLVYILVNEMIPSYQIIQDCYQLEFEGLNLEVKHCMEILARTPEINAENIRGLGAGDRFYVQSVTDPSCEYLVDLNNRSW